MNEHYFRVRLKIIYTSTVLYTVQYSVLHTKNKGRKLGTLVTLFFLNQHFHWFRYLENVIKGKDDTPPLVKSLRDHLASERLPHSRDKTWICSKVNFLR